MAIPNPDHFFDQAFRLSGAQSRGKPRQVDLRRAISAAYYGLFHFTLSEVCDAFIGRAGRGSPRFTLLYRSVDHRSLLVTCEEVGKGAAPAGKYRPYVPAGGFDMSLQDFSRALVSLQRQRHRADYDPSARYSQGSAEAEINGALQARQAFHATPLDHRHMFLTLIVAPPR